MKQMLIIVIALSFFNDIQCQSKAKIFVKGNYNFFNMTDLKNLQQELLSDILDQGIPANITDSYPAYFGFQAGFLIPLRKLPAKEISVGGFIDYTSTGGRIHYADYSGEIKGDQVASAFSIGAILSICTTSNDFFELDLDLNARIIFSSFKNEFLTRIFNESQKQSLEFSSISFGIEPTLVPSVTFYNFNFGFSISYLLAIPTTLEYNQYNDAYLVNKNGDEVAINWSGFKFGVITKYSF